MGIDRSVGAIQATIGGRGGRAVITAGNDSTTLAIEGQPERAEIERLLGAALDRVVELGGGDVHWWVQGAGPDDDVTAVANGLTPGRRLLQMQRLLPTSLPVEIETRPFRVGIDEEAWLRQNNRSFKDHPEQGGWTMPTLLRQEAEPWFDAAGFRLYEREGRLAGSCWTKLHTADRPRDMIGEIYAISVDPDFSGVGLGTQLTLAGLESISERGVTTALLYVDAANILAVKLYERLGFEVTREDRAYTARLAAQGR